MKRKGYGFVLVAGLWVTFTVLCYERMIVFDNTTISGAMVSSLILSSSTLGAIRLLKMLYDGLYPIFTEEDSKKN